MEDFKEGQEIEFKYTKTGKWYSGRIRKIEPQVGWKAIYLIEEYKECKILDWENILEGIERGGDHIDTQGKECFKLKTDWFPIRWFSKDYIRPIAN